MSKFKESPFKKGDRVRVTGHSHQSDNYRKLPVGSEWVVDEDGCVNGWGTCSGFHSYELVVEEPKRDPIGYIKGELEKLKDDLSIDGLARSDALESVLEHGFGIAVSYKSTTTVIYTDEDTRVEQAKEHRE